MYQMYQLQKQLNSGHHFQQFSESDFINVFQQIFKQGFSYKVRIRNYYRINAGIFSVSGIYHSTSPVFLFYAL